MHLARDGDCIWGAGVRGDMPETAYSFSHLDVRAVRGPLTREFLLRRGIAAPAVYGDPALLLPDLFPELRTWASHKTRRMAVVPHFSEYDKLAAEYPAECVNPRGDMIGCLRAIAESELVVGSSLHGIVVAESLGIPARLTLAPTESQDKYRDYYLGTDRDPVTPAASVAAALRDSAPPGKVITASAALLAAFPQDLWEGK